MARASREPEQEKDSAKEEDADPGYVQYIGRSHVRKFTTADLAAVGIPDDDQAPLSWDKSNDWIIPRGEIPDSVYERAIQYDLELILVDAKGNRL